MEPIYVTGHKNPDTDSIVAAIAYTSLRNALGERNFVAARIGEISDQTEMVLKKFGFDPPTLLRTVRTQVSDLSYDTPPILSSAVTVHHAWGMLESDSRGVPALPVTDEEGRLYGMLAPEDIASYDMRFVEDNTVTGVSLFNLLSCLDGQLLCGENANTEFSGPLVLALPNYDGMPAFLPGGVVICGNQPDVIRRAVENHAGCVIVCESEVDRSLYEHCTETCVVTTPYDAYIASRLVFQAVPISRICQTKELVAFHLTDYVDDVKETTLKSRYRSYPITDESGMVVGTLSRFHLLRPNRKRVVLVDHNELGQSVPGLEQAEIVEIIDHHRIADVQTAYPVFVRNEPVGSTCTIITSMFFERGILPSRKLAGLLAAGILSDTIMFKSPTSTSVDRVMAERLSKIGGVDLTELGKEIFAVSMTGGHDLKELLFSDFKQFQIAGHSLGIGQVTCLDSEQFGEQRGELIGVMETERAARGYDMLLLMLTDVLREGTELIGVGDLDTVEHAFNVKVKDNAVFLPGVISRKKQVVPALSLLWG